MSESPSATRESAGEDVAANRVRVSRNRLVHTVTPRHVRERIDRGGCGCKSCPGVTRSCWSYRLSHTRMESAGEGVAERSARLSQSRVHHVPHSLVLVWNWSRMDSRRPYSGVVSSSRSHTRGSDHIRFVRVRREADARCTSPESIGFTFTPPGPGFYIWHRTLYVQDTRVPSHSPLLHH